MRNLKKFLALALAVMMTFSLMVTANAAIDTSAAVTDKDSITEEFKEAVAVLNGLKIITGYETGDKQYEFRPEKPISRQEATALVYRLHSGDADNVKNNLYSTADNIAKFKDVNPNGAQQWSAGYIGYCANQEIIKGVGANRFNPTGNVTGYQMLAMVLRAIGYGQKGEYEGSGWQTRVATTATNLGMLKNIDDTNYAGTLSAPATRELVAEIVFQAALLKQVIWNDAFGYVSKNQITGLTLESLGVEKFDLKCSTYRVIDKWGRPGYYWFQGSTVKSDLSNVVATIKALPVKTYDTTVRECDVAHDLDIATNATYSLYVNRNTAITNNYRIEATDTVTKVGGQGRVTEFYGDLTNPHVAGDTWSKSVVMIDTYLATVTKVTERVVDPAGHVIVPAYLYLDVHDGQAVGAANKTDGYEPAAATDTVTRNTSEHVASNKDANWEYAVGDKLLIQGYTDYTQRDAYQQKNNPLANPIVSNDTFIDNGSGLNHLFNNSVEAANKAAFETNILGTDDSKINIVQKSNPVLGKQTVTYWNQGKHTVDGKDYNDAMTLFLDVAGTTTNTTFAWYFDTKGNLIGIDNVPNTVNYGVITSIWTSFNQGETNTDGTAKTYAKVLYADGTEATITIDRFLVTNTASTAVNAGGHVAPTTAGTAGATLSITTTTGNTAELIPAYDYNAGNANTMSGATRSGTAKDASQAGYLHVAPVASINDAQDANTGTGKFGIIKGNLFKFEASANGETTVIEVAGDGTNAGKFVGHYYTINDDNTTTAKTGKLFKNLGCMSVDGGSNAFAWLDSNTRIMLNDGSDDEKVSCYTLSTLPGDVLIKPSSEIDWADTNNDGRVDVVYLTGTIEGTTTYNLFYYNGGAAQWNGADKKGTLFGWLNGEPTTVNFDDEAELNAVKNSQGYAGHLFALQMTNGVVSNVMYSKNQSLSGTNYNRFILTDESSATPANTSGTVLKFAATPATDTTATNLSVDSAFTAGSADFKLGAANGNPYTVTTEAVYIEDVDDNTTIVGTEKHVAYNADAKTISDGTDTYYLVPNSKVIGLGMSVNQESAILDYLNKSVHNDVTIVYEVTGGNMKSIVEIYVATDPNVTPGGEVTVDPGKPGYGVTALTNISGGISDANLTAAIKGVGPNSVVYSPYASTTVAGAQNKAPQFLYFPFVGETGNTTGAALTIYKNGVPVFQENTNSAVAGAKYFVINFASGTSSNTTITSGPLTAGTYTFKIVSNGTGATLSSGTFVMN